MLNVDKQTYKLMFETERPYVEGDPVSRVCSRCQYHNVPLIKLNARGQWVTRKEPDRICPDCGQHCSNTPY